MTRPMSADELVAALRHEGQRRYHDEHPFHQRMHRGELSPTELRRWVRNRYYYQTRIPIKDALIVAKSEDPAFRRAWLRRIQDHDGVGEDDGGLSLWRRLAAAAGVAQAELDATADVLPGVRAACDDYVELVRGAALVEAVAASLTECFAPDLMLRRIAAWEAHYPWVDPQALEYFRQRVPRARRDGDEALRFVVAHARTRAEQDACIVALLHKTQILWRILDSVAAEPS